MINVSWRCWIKMGSHGDMVEKKALPIWRGSGYSASPDHYHMGMWPNWTNLLIFFQEKQEIWIFFFKVLAQFLKIALWEQIKHFTVEYGPGTTSLQALVQDQRPGYSCQYSLPTHPLTDLPTIDWFLSGSPPISCFHNHFHNQCSALLLGHLHS